MQRDSWVLRRCCFMARSWSQPYMPMQASLRCPRVWLLGGWAAVAMDGFDRCSGGGASDLLGMGTLERSLRAEHQTLRSPKHGGAVES